MQNRAVGVWIMRMVLGLIFFMQGYGKIFTIGIEQLYESAFAAFEKTFLPNWLLWFTASFTSFAELLCGLMLILGIGRKWALYILGVVLIVVSFGHGLQSPIWDLGHVFPRLVLVGTLLVIPEDWDRIHLDNILSRKSVSSK
ncbi:MAG: DoxX family protein [Bacteroidia bacterium]|nr:DoxX family protein [Bacteroidia bacterium]